MQKTVRLDVVEMYTSALPFSKPWDIHSFGLRDERFCGYENLFLGVARIEGYDLVFTQITQRSDSIYQRKDEIQLYEVAANTATYKENDVDKTTIFYNTDNIYDLNNSKVWLKLNSTKGHELRRKGLSLPDILTMLDIEFEKSPLEDTIKARFTREGSSFDGYRDELALYGLGQRNFERCSSFQGREKVKRGKAVHPNTIRAYNRL